ARRVVAAIDAAPGLTVAGAMTHFATADEVGDAFLGEQLATFAPFAAEVKQTHPDAVIHAANSAATLRDPATHFDLVRCGVAIYGLDPFQRDPAEQDLEPALDLRSYVAAVNPIGYGDGVRRALTNNADVVVRGRRHPLVGTVSMDNITVDLGLETDVRCYDEAVLLGDGVLAEEWARRLDTINYEITCALTPRVERRYHRD